MPESGPEGARQDLQPGEIPMCHGNHPETPNVRGFLMSTHMSGLELPIYPLLWPIVLLKTTEIRKIPGSDGGVIVGFLQG